MGDRSSWLVLKIALTCETISDVLSKTIETAITNKYQSSKELTTTQWKPTISIKPENNRSLVQPFIRNQQTIKSREIAPRDRKIIKFAWLQYFFFTPQWCFC